MLYMGENPNIGTDQNCKTPLELAVMKGHKGMVIKLLDYHASLCYHTEIGPSPLAYAIANQHDDIIQALLLSGANPLNPVCCPKHLPFTLALKMRNRNALGIMMLTISQADPPLRSNYYQSFQGAIDWVFGFDDEAVGIPEDISNFEECEIWEYPQTTSQKVELSGSAETSSPRPADNHIPPPLREELLKEHNQNQQNNIFISREWANHDALSHAGTKFSNPSSVNAVDPTKSLLSESDIEAAAQVVSRAMSEASSKSRSNSVTSNAGHAAKQHRPGYSYKNYSNSWNAKPNQNRPSSVGSSAGSDSSFWGRYSAYGNYKPKYAYGSNRTARLSDPAIGGKYEARRSSAGNHGISRPSSNQNLNYKLSDSEINYASTSRQSEPLMYNSDRLSSPYGISPYERVSTSY